MEEQDVFKILGEVKAVITDSHIVYTSGKHGSAYVNKDAVYLHTLVTSDLCMELANAFANDKVDVVVAPAIGGVILSQWTASHLTCLTWPNPTNHEILSVYAEKVEGGQTVNGQ